MRPGLAPLSDRLESMEQQIRAIAGRMDLLEADAHKYESELAYWRYLVKEGGSQKDFGAPFEEIFGRWQRNRLLKLGTFLGLPEPGQPGDVDDWCAARSVVEIGAGPYPAVAAAARGWKRCVAVDPIAKGYVEEGLLPRAAESVVYIDAPGERIPLPAGFADLVVIENCLDHVTNPTTVLNEILRLLRPGGFLWLFVDLSDHCDHMHPHPMNEARIRGLMGSFNCVRDEVSNHKAHPEAYGGYRALYRKPESARMRQESSGSAVQVRPSGLPGSGDSIENGTGIRLNGSANGRPLP